MTFSAGSLLLHGDVDGDLVARAGTLRPLLAEHAVRTETERQVVPEVIEALEAAGLFDVMVPKRAGGLGGTMASQLAVSAELGRACASTAWVQSIINVTTWGATRSAAGTALVEQIGEGPRPRMCGVIAPTGTATPTDGGYLVTGQWPFASGSFHANWFTGGLFVHDVAGGVADIGMALMPLADLSIIDTWHVAGMAGTSSNTLVATDVFVRADRITSLADQSRHGDDPSDLWPLGSVLALVLLGPMIGAGRAAFDAVVDKAPKRAISYTSYAVTTDSIVAVTDVARAGLDIDSAWMHAFQAAAYVDAVGAGGARDRVEETRIRGQIGYATALLRHGVDTLLDVAGAGSFANVNLVQRLWRDLNVGSRHAFLASNPSLETYGRGLFGLDPILVVL